MIDIKYSIIYTVHSLLNLYDEDVKTWEQFT